VKARPSRPSGKRTVSNFLSSLTTTLHTKHTLIQYYCRTTSYKGKNHTRDKYLPELFKSIPPRVRLTSPLLWGNEFCNARIKN
jgi:hypothetical protein